MRASTRSPAASAATAGESVIFNSRSGRRNDEGEWVILTSLTYACTQALLMDGQSWRGLDYLRGSNVHAADRANRDIDAGWRGNDGSGKRAARP